MEWFIDGKPVFDTSLNGNLIASRFLWAHTFAVELAPGKHVLAARIRPSGKPCALRSLGGLLNTGEDMLEEFLIAKAPSELSEDEARRWLIPHSGRTLAARMAREAAARAYNMTPAFTELPDAHALLKAWRQRVAPVRPQMRALIAADPNSDWAKRAAGWLSHAAQ